MPHDMGHRSTSLNSLRGRRALVTGGTRGIGVAIARALDAGGWSVFLVGQDSTRLQSCCTQLGNASAGAAVDLAQGEAAARQIYSAYTETAPSLDLLVLNAGIFAEQPLREISAESLRQTFAVNFEVNLYLARCFLPSLRRGTKPRIVLIGSAAAYEPYSLGPAYGVSKWALRGLAVNLRDELRAERIGVTFVAPGGTWTDMWDEGEVAPERLLEAGDIATLVATLPELSEQAVVEEIILQPMLGSVRR